MARELRSDLKELQRVFAKQHGCFRIINASVDELNCKFYGKNEILDIQANITVSFFIDFFIVCQNGRLAAASLPPFNFFS